PSNLLASHTFNNISTATTDYSYTLVRGDKIPNSYGDLSIGFAMSSGGNTMSFNVYGVSLDTADTSALGNPVLTINGYLQVNSQLSNAVRLSGTKNATKLKIVDLGSGSGFNILSPGKCSGCTIQTVACPVTVCWQPPGGLAWNSFSPAIPDPLRFMVSPTDAGVITTSSCPSGYTRYNPGVYPTLQINSGSNACLNGGIYILDSGMSVNGGATVVGQNVMFFNRHGAITINGGASVNLTAYNSYPYSNILIFQARCPGDSPTGCAASNYNDSPITLSGGTVINGNPSALASLLGIVYAPASTGVTLGTGGANMRVTAVVAQNLTVTGGSFVTIG
ncbi:MAG: hypothetical protein M3P18_09475, partial [Actinomycetota bacterium]|nr:hypothetical protein [Actinomycetota bacterium]